MSRQGDACRALGNSIDVAETMILQKVINSINEGKLLLDHEQLQTLKEDVRAALTIAKDRGIDQVMKATQD